MSRRQITEYDPAVNNYDLTKDPRCLWGWGPPPENNPGTPKTCRCTWGHTCAFQLGHTGKCWDGDDTRTATCSRAYRPADWDATGRAEANR